MFEKNIFSSMMLAISLVFSAMQAQAIVIWDYSPDAFQSANNSPGIGATYSNQSTGQNFYEDILLASNVSLTGMALYSNKLYGDVGSNVTIRIRSDNANQPDQLLYNFTESISEVDTVGTSVNSTFTDVVRKFASFTTPVNLLANTRYWIGMSGTGGELGMNALSGNGQPDNGQVWLYTNLDSSRNASIGDMSMRLYGEIDSVSVPEPASLALLGIGLAGLGFTRRRRRA